MFGVKTYVWLAILTSKYRLSKMLAKKLLAELYELPISVGSVSNIEQNGRRNPVFLKAG